MKKMLFIILILISVLLTLVIVGIRKDWTLDTLVGVVWCEYSLEGVSPNKKFGGSDIAAPRQVITGCTFEWQCENLEDEGKNYCYYTIAQERQDPAVCEKITNSSKESCLKDMQ